MTERDPIERLEAADGLSIAPRPAFAEELRVVLDLRLRLTEHDAEVNGDPKVEGPTDGRQRPDRLHTWMLVVLGLLVCSVIALVTYLAVWTMAQSESPDAPAVTAATEAPVPDESDTGSPDVEAPLSDVETLLADAGCRVIEPGEGSGFDCSGVDLSDTLLDGASLAGSNFVGARMPGASFAGADLSGAVLNGAWLYAADLTGANLSGAEIVGADLNDARLVDANLSHSVIQDTFLTGVDLTDATLHGTVLTDVILYEADLTDADLTSASLTRVDLTFATVRGIVLRNAKISQMQLTQLDFTGADFTGLRAAADWFLTICPDGSSQGVRETVPCGIRD